MVIEDVAARRQKPNIIGQVWALCPGLTTKDEGGGMYFIRSRVFGELFVFKVTVREGTK